LRTLSHRSIGLTGAPPLHALHPGHTETSGPHTMRAAVINNSSDPVTHSLANPFTRVSLAWGTARATTTATGTTRRPRR
jgi:hypothetical protein